MKPLLGKLILHIACNLGLLGFRLCGADTRDMCVQLALMLKPEVQRASLERAVKAWEERQAAANARERAPWQAPSEPTESGVRWRDLN
jgi:hypothetical protein